MTAAGTPVEPGLTVIKVQLAELGGKLDTLAALMEAGDRQSAQLVALVKDQLTYLSADQGELKAIVRELSQRNEIGLSALRVDLERRLDEHRQEIDTLKLWRARLMGLAAGTSMISALLTGLAVKWISP